MIKRLNLVALVFAGIFLLSLTSVLACDDNHRILRISSSSNAHGEVYDGSNNYPVEICTTDIFSEPVPVGPSPHECTGSNKVLGLSSNTNAHAQNASLSTYPIDVCYGNLVCTLRDNDCNSDETCVVTLSASTNAHLAECSSSNAYNKKVCCKVGGSNNDSSNPFAYWTNLNHIEINNIVVVPGRTRVRMVAERTGFSQGSTAMFNIYENDLGQGDDEDSIEDGIRSSGLTGNVDADGKVESVWQISEQDLTNAGNENEMEFYFSVFNESSQHPLVLSKILKVTSLGPDYCELNDISFCSDYTTEENCTSDPCAIAEQSVEQANPDITCGGHFTDVNDCDHWYSCACTWDATNNVCTANWNDNIDEDSCAQDNGVDAIGNCTYSENTAQGDDCTDGFLFYSWNAEWTWDSSNIFDSNPDGNDFVYDSNDGKWHYDPSRISQSCQPGGQTIPCPAQVKVPFFGILQLILAILIIVIIYYLMKNKQTKPVPSRKRTVKKKAPASKKAAKKKPAKKVSKKKASKKKK